MNNQTDAPTVGDGDHGQAIGHSTWFGDRFFYVARLRERLRRYRLALRFGWWVPVLSLLVVGGPALWVAARRPPVFRSEATMWLAGRLSLPGGKIYSEELSTYIGTQCELIKNGPIQPRAFAQVRARFPELAASGTGESSAPLPFRLRVQSTLRSSVLQLQATGPS